jgi:branched-chain amino acid transport system substrate-binding protein
MRQGTREAMRKWMRAVASCLFTLLVVTSLQVTTGAQAGEGTVRVGVLNDQSGVFADSTGAGSTLSARMAAEDFGGKVAGLPIEVVSADHQNKPDIGATIARRWFDLDKVDVIVDLGNSAVALAVNEIAREKNRAILVSAGGTTALTGKACSPNTVQWTYDTWSQSNAIGSALVKAGHRSWYFLTADYTFGYNLRDETSKVVRANGGEVLGSVSHPINTSDFSSLLIQAQASRADVIALANGGADTANAIKQANEFQLSKNGQVIVGLSTMITDINALGLSTMKGLYVTETFYWDLNAQTREWSKRWAARNNGRYPTMMQAGVYASVLHYLKAVQAVGDVADGRKVIAKMKELPTDDPLFGKGRILANGRKIHDVDVFQVKAPEESQYPWDFYKLVSTVPGEQAFLSLAESGCALGQ